MLEKIDKRQTYHIANGVFIVLWLIYFIAILNHPFLGLNLEKQGQHWVVADADLYGNGYLSGIRAGDIIVSIDNKVPGIYPSVQQWREIGGASFIEVKSHGQPSRIIRITENPFFLTLLQEIPRH